MDLDINSVIEDETIDFECSKCNSEFEIKLALVLKAKVVDCPSCSAIIRVGHNDTNKREIAKLKRELKNIDSFLKKILN